MAVWDRVTRIMRAPAQATVAPKTMAELQAHMALGPRGGNKADKTRWAVLYRTAVWALWKAYLSHSFASPKSFWHPAAASKYCGEMILGKIHPDRVKSLTERFI